MNWKDRLFSRFLSSFSGVSMRLEFPDGSDRMIGDASADPIIFTLHDRNFYKKLVASGGVGFGESYVDGDWSTNDLTRLLCAFAQNSPKHGRLNRGVSVLTKRVNRALHQRRRNTVEQSRTNISEHYDLNNAFYELFLDPSMTYSSALFEGNERTLEEAQYAKIDRMLDLANVKNGSKILEIGSGWGALALRAARRGAKVKTITLSNEQYSYARDLFEREGVGDRVEIVLEDYRDQTGHYDAVLSCEMIEAVGKEYLPSYFEIIDSVLKPEGRAVLQAITIPDERYETYSNNCDWIQKHIFPGGHLPSVGAIHSCLSQTDSKVAEIFSFGQDYAKTLDLWQESFRRETAAVEALGFDATFRRKWNYYLSYCSAGFQTDMIDVQHLLITKE